MVKPLNEHNLGDTGMGISFFNGTAVVTGYAMKQTGPSTFIVTEDGVATKKVSLAPSTSAATDLAQYPDHCTIPITTVEGTVEHVASIWDTKANTTEGNTMKWSFKTSINGAAVIAEYSTATKETQQRKNPARVRVRVTQKSARKR